MKRLRLRFYSYKSACVFLSMLVIIMSACSVFAFMYTEIGPGIVFVLLIIVFSVAIWLILKSGIVIDFKKNRLTLFSLAKRKTYAIDNIKDVSIAFRFNEIYRRWSAKVTIYFNNGQSEIIAFSPFRARFYTIGIPLSNKRKIELDSEKCNLIRCYTVS